MSKGANMLGRVGRTLTLVGYIGLFFLLLGWIALGPGYPLPRVLVLLILVGPLLLPLRGLLAGRAYTHVWASYLAIFYFILAILHLSSGTSPWLAIPQLLLILAWFSGCFLYVRYRERPAPG